MNKENTPNPAAAKTAKATAQDPFPTDPLEIEARRRALEGIRNLRDAYTLLVNPRFNAENTSHKQAGPWGEAYAKVCEAVTELAVITEKANKLHVFFDAYASVNKLENVEDRALRAALDAQCMSAKNADA